MELVENTHPGGATCATHENQSVYMYILDRDIDGS
jgi:hypothetical protein